MQVIGLTGGIASGKSTVSYYLITHGYEVIDADSKETKKTRKETGNFRNRWECQENCVSSFNKSNIY